MSLVEVIAKPYMPPVVLLVDEALYAVKSFVVGSNLNSWLVLKDVTQIVPCESLAISISVVLEPGALKVRMMPVCGSSLPRWLVLDSVNQIMPCGSTAMP